MLGTGLLAVFRGQPLDPVASTFVGAFLLASVAGPQLLPPSAVAASTAAVLLVPPAYLVSGLLVGFGTRLGNGCTSGHGVCGLSRLSKRGGVAVAVFMAVGMSVASVLGHQGWAANLTAAPSKRDRPLARTVPWWTPAVLGLAAFLVLWRAPTKATQRPWVHVAALVSGALFALGLAWSGMTQQAKVLNFLWPRMPGWDPSLMVVLGTTVSLLTPVTLWVLSHQKAALGDPSAKMHQGKGPLAVSRAEQVDWRLVVGEVAFGLGWGVTGLCPGPALALVALGHQKVVLFFAPAYVLGYLLVDVVDRAMGGGGATTSTKTKKTK